MQSLPTAPQASLPSTPLPNPPKSHHPHPPTTSHPPPLLPKGIAMDSSFVYIVTEFMPRTLLTRMDTGSAVISDKEVDAETDVVRLAS